MNAARKLFLAAVWLAAAGSAAAQPAEQGSLLVASPTMPDPSFSESVLLLLRHDENGSLGVLINRPTTLAPSAVFDELTALAGYDGTLFYGGPVLPTRLLLLLRHPPPALTEGVPVFGDVFVSGDPSLLERADGWVGRSSDLRLYAGHMAWEPEQLDAEIAAGHWTVVDGRADQVFSDQPLELWQRALGAGGEVVVAVP